MKILKSGKRSNREIDCCLTGSIYSVVKAVNVSTVIIKEKMLFTELIFWISLDISALNDLGIADK